MRDVLCANQVFTFNFTSIASNEACLRQGWFQGCVEVDQGAGNAVTDGAGLTGFAATGYVNFDVERFGIFSQNQRLTYNHAAGFTCEEFVNGTAVYDDLAGTFSQEYTSH